MILTKQNVGHARGMEGRPFMGKNDTRDVCSFYVLPCNTLVIGHSRFLWLQEMISQVTWGQTIFNPKANFLLQQHRKLPFV